MSYQHNTQNHESFYYDSDEEKSFLEPEENKKDKNIKGIEFEINDPNESKVDKYIDRLVDNKVICSFDMMHEYRRKFTNCIWTYDGTVNHELVLQAELPRNLGLKIKTLNEYLNPTNIQNVYGTSVHIHMNNQYLRNLGLNDLDMIKAGECISSTLLAISGRQKQYELDKWVKTRIGYSHKMPIIQRSQYIDDIEIDDYRDYSHESGHYMMINVESDATTELRMFSNYCNFDYNRIKVFLETCDMLQEIALSMQGLNYKDNYEIVIDIVRDFYENHYRRKTYFPEIKTSIIQSKSELERYETQCLVEDINDMFNNIINMYNNEIYNNENTNLYVLRTLRDIENKYNIIYDGMIDLDNINPQVILDRLTTQILR